MSFPCAMRFVLASYLIGIERSEQVATYPLRGVLFENLVIAEALKYRFNHGRRFNLSFSAIAVALNATCCLKLAAE